VLLRLVLADTNPEGGIVKFLKEKAQSVGLAYPGGTGRFEERITMIFLTRKKAANVHEYRNVLSRKD